MPILFRAARLIALAIVIGWSLANAIQRIEAWSLSDMDAYWNAAMRLRDGAPLYPRVIDLAAVDIYKYAPWFAWLWVPLTYLPRSMVGALWSAVLLGATAAAIWPVIVQRTLTSTAVACLLGSILLWSSASGNVQPLLVAVLVWGVERRSGPMWIGLAASLKVFPILFAAVYAGRRQWGRVIAALLVAILLWAPALTYDLRSYPGSFQDSPNPLLAVDPLLYVVAALVAVTVAAVAARTRFAWLASAVSVYVSLARVSLIDLSYLTVSSAPADRTIQPDAVKSERATVPPGRGQISDARPTEDLPSE